MAGRPPIRRRRRFDLVTLRFGLATTGPDLLAGFDERLRAAIPADRLRAYWAHMSLRLVDWSIRHHGDAEVRFWLDQAEPAITGG